jgi:hypothetical protein
MLRLFYLFLSAIVTLLPCGCAAPAGWLAGDVEADEREPREMKPRAGSAATDTADADQPSADAKKAPTDFARRSIAAATGGRDSPSHQPQTQVSAGKSLAMSQTKAADTGAPATDPLAEQVRALAFDDPAEQASALAALRSAPPAHRSFLLRTMQASAAVRKQNEARAATALHSGDGQDFGELSSTKLAAGSRAGVGNSAASKNTNLGEQTLDARKGPANNVVRAVSHSEPVGSNSRQPFGVPQPLPNIDTAQQADGDWQAHTSRAIAALESQLASGGGGADRAALEARLRLLCLAAGRRDEALRSRQGTPLDEQDFWSKEVFGLATLFDTAKEPDAQRRAAVAAPHLRQAAERLGEIGGLAVKNLHFCTEVKGYGSFASFPQDEFRPGQEVLLYCEVENFQSKLGDKGYHTALKARYQVFDASGNRVAEKDLGLKEEHCQNRRRDFFVPYFLWMPKQVPSGKYQLKLTLEDIHAGQTSEATIEFSIKDK